MLNSSSSYLLSHAQAEKPEQSHNNLILDMQYALTLFFIFSSIILNVKIRQGKDVSK